jgi:PD-(D/E)XK nuclease superfamily
MRALVPDGAELILSKSSIDVWLDCHRKWMYAYVYRVPGAPNIDMAVGTAVHAGVEALLNGKDPFKALQKSWKTVTALMPNNDSVEARQALADAHTLFRVYQANIAPTLGTVIAIEKDFLVRVNGVLMSGRIDVADQDVHDTKTTATPSKVNPNSHRLGMTLYKHGYRALTGSWPVRLVLDIVARNGRWKQLEVEPDDAELAEIAGMVAKGINDGDFEPTGAAKGSCHKCAYVALCPAAVV